MEQRKTPPEHGRFPYSAIVDRPTLRWPNGARVAVWVIPNVEHYLFDRGGIPLSSATARLSPDILNYGWRDFGVRVGIWRTIEAMERHGFKGTVALNSDVCERYPRIIEAGNQLGWEWMGHGTNNSVVFNDQPEDEERALIRRTVDAIAKGTGKRPRGWLGAALAESVHTLDLLAEEGLDYVCDWTNDEQPYPMHVRRGNMTAIPYSVEINDIPAILELKQSGESFGRMIRDHFDVLYEDGATTGRVMAICLHAFLTGVPHRSRYLEQALAYIASRKEVWLTTGAQIVDHYNAHREQAPAR
jgi:allantoinase